MRVIVVGLGIQGHKRKHVRGHRFRRRGRSGQRRSRIPLDRRMCRSRATTRRSCCIPDEPKIELLSTCSSNGKHVLVEKPLWAARRRRDRRAGGAGPARTAPSATRPTTIASSRTRAHARADRQGGLGRIYHCRMFYGNGTARLVRDSAWRDQGAGVLPDLGSHLLDTAHSGSASSARSSVSCLRQPLRESRARPRRDRLGRGTPALELEMTLLTWRNHFTCDVFAENGSAHVDSLCKWGPTTLHASQARAAEGRPPEETVTLVQDDPTWALEYAHFKAPVRRRRADRPGNDLWLNRMLRRLGDEAIAEVSR